MCGGNKPRLESRGRCGDAVIQQGVKERRKVICRLALCLIKICHGVGGEKYRKEVSCGLQSVFYSVTAKSVRNNVARTRGRLIKALIRVTIEVPKCLQAAIVATGLPLSVPAW